MKLKDKVAIITGGGTGIGKDISLAFANEGAAVVVAARNPSRLEEVAKDIKSRGGKAKAIQTDISNHEQIKRMVAQTIDEFGQIDVLVNNAAAMYPNNADVVDMNLDNWHNTLKVNLTGTMLCSREVLKYMIPRRSGNIINVSSVAGLSGHPTESPYCVSKWGIIGFTEALAIEAGKHSIRVNCISPGASRSKEFENIVRVLAKRVGISYEEMMGKIVDKNSLKRIAEPSEIAACVVFLASDDSSAITGHNLIASCGFHITHPEEIR
ncbi:MAG: SDR family oxidoreductase [Dehalococcoidia bacterium]|nr:SDR family oxidoreductase [Dehalococcoidia bacterium]